MGFSDREGYTAEAEAMRRQELAEHGACETCEGKGMIDEGNETCPDCDGSGLASEPPATLPVYDRKNYRTFVRDMEAAGLEPYHYRGRWYWEGPAVNVDDLQDALSNTKVPCQWDNMGLGWVVYPKG